MNHMSCSKVSYVITYELSCINSHLLYLIMAVTCDHEPVHPGDCAAFCLCGKC